MLCGWRCVGAIWKSCEYQSRNEEKEWVRRVRVCVVHRLHFIARVRGDTLTLNSSTLIQDKKKRAKQHEPTMHASNFSTESNWSLSAKGKQRKKKGDEVCVRERVVTQFKSNRPHCFDPISRGEHEAKRNKNEERVWEKEERERPCHFGHDKQIEGWGREGTFEPQMHLLFWFECVCCWLLTRHCSWPHVPHLVFVNFGLWSRFFVVLRLRWMITSLLIQLYLPTFRPFFFPHWLKQKKEKYVAWLSQLMLFAIETIETRLSFLVWQLVYRDEW